MNTMDGNKHKGNLIIIDEDDDDDKDERTVNRDSALADSIRSNPGTTYDQVRRGDRPDGKDVDRATTQERDSALPDSPRHSMTETSHDTLGNLNILDTMYGIPSIEMEQDKKRKYQNWGAITQSDEFTSMFGAVDIKDETQNKTSDDEKDTDTNKDADKDKIDPREPNENDTTDIGADIGAKPAGNDNHDREIGGDSSKPPAPLDNILSSLTLGQPSLESMESMRSSEFDPILSHRLPQREKTVKPKVPTTSQAIETYADVKEDNLDEKQTDITKDVDAESKARVQDKPDIKEKDPATLSVKDKSLKFKKGPPPAPKPRRSLDIRSSVKERHAVFEKSRDTGQKDEVSEAVKPRRSLPSNPNFLASLKFAESSSKTSEDTKETVNERPKRRLNVNPSFRASQQLAESHADTTQQPSKDSTSGNLEDARSSKIKPTPRPRNKNASFKAAKDVVAMSDIPLRSFSRALPTRIQEQREGSNQGTVNNQVRLDDRSDDAYGPHRAKVTTQDRDNASPDNTREVVYERPAQRLNVNPSFGAPLQLAEGHVTTAQLPGVDSAFGNLEGTRSFQTRANPRPQNRNPSFKAAREAMSSMPLNPFDTRTRPKRIQTLTEASLNLDQSKSLSSGNGLTDLSDVSIPRANCIILDTSDLSTDAEMRETRETKPIRSGVIKETEKTKKDSCMVIGAMDFGTATSAVVFAFKNDPYKIFSKAWNETSEVKVPTVVLLDPDQNVYSFGEAAKMDFRETFDNKDTYKNWFYFDCFKMKLYVTDKYFDKDIILEDYTGKTMKALDVFSKVIAYLREQLLEFLNDNRRGVIINPDTDVHWVLTVPAIWPDLSKAFMREAAEKAGIPSDLLTLALEPEAASLYCRRQLGVDLRGKRYIVLDLGGGTADYVCHEILSDDSVKECHMATGGDFGGKFVDNEFFKLFVQIYGSDVMEQFKKTKVYIDFCDQLELKKKQFDGSRDFTFKIPIDTLHGIYSGIVRQSIESAMEQSPLKGKISWQKDRIVIKKDLVCGIFDKAFNKIVETTKQIMNKTGHIDRVIMVGGFSCSKYITDCMKQHYPEQGFVLVPEDPQLAVVNGAVTFGHESKAIFSRISKYTYGIGRAMIFKLGDPENRKFRANNAWWCEDCFCKHIEIGEEIRSDEEAQAIDYYPPDANVRNFYLEVFASTKKDPRYTNEEDCYSIGILRLEVDTHGDVWSKIQVKLIYKGTELELQAYDVKNNKLTTGKVEFWG